jgi:Protein of unknown function (DUF2167)
METQSLEMMMLRFAGVVTVVSLIMIVMHIWCVVKVARSSGLMAVLVFFLPFFSYIALIKYWGDDDSDIRKPMAYSHGAWLLLIIFVFTFGARHADQAANDPFGLKGQDLSAVRESVPSAVDTSDASDERQAQTRLREIVSELKKDHGTVLLPSINATLEVPKHFRFISIDQLNRLAEVYDFGLSDSTLGWLVHERVDLAAANPWYVELSWDDRGFFPEADFATKPAAEFLVEAQRLSVKLSRANAEAGFPQFSLMALPSAPQWIASENIATWVEKLAWEGADTRTLDCYALKQARFGLLVFTVTDQDVARNELCLRAVRLGARSVTFAPSHDVAARDASSDKSSEFVLADYVTGRVALATAP